MVLERTLESPWDLKEIKPVNHKGNQPWIFTGRTDADAPILWSPGVTNWLIRKDPDAEKDWKQEEKGTTEDKIVGSFTNSTDMSLQALWDSEGQGSLVCCSPWDHKELDGTERQNNEPHWRWDTWMLLSCTDIRPSKKIMSCKVIQEMHILSPSLNTNCYICQILKSLRTLQVNPYTNSLSFLHMRT